MRLTKPKIKKPFLLNALKVNRIKEGAAFQLPSFVVRYYRDRIPQKYKKRPAHSYIYKELKKQLQKAFFCFGLPKPKIWMKEFIVLDDTITFGLFLSLPSTTEIVDARDLVNEVIKNFELSGKSRRMLFLSFRKGVDVIPYYNIDPYFYDPTPFQYVFPQYRNRIECIKDYAELKLRQFNLKGLSINESLLKSTYFANNTPFLGLKIVEEEQ